MKKAVDIVFQQNDQFIHCWETELDAADVAGMAEAVCVTGLVDDSKKVCYIIFEAETENEIARGSFRPSMI